MPSSASASAPPTHKHVMVAGRSMKHMVVASDPPIQATAMMQEQDDEDGAHGADAPRAVTRPSGHRSVHADELQLLLHCDLRNPTYEHHLAAAPHAVHPADAAMAGVSITAAFVSNEVPAAIASKRRPILNENFPLTLLFHADVRWQRAIRKLRKEGDVMTPRYRSRLYDVHEAQKRVLQAIWIIRTEAGPLVNADRGYRQQLPLRDQEELDGCYSENILFAAQALSRGFRIRGIEAFAPELRVDAQVVCASLDALRHALLYGAASRRRVPVADFQAGMAGVLQDFDAAWCRFENHICFTYLEATAVHDAQQGLARPQYVDASTMMQTLLTSTIEVYLENGILDRAAVEACDPDIVFALPRLALFRILVDAQGLGLLDANEPRRSSRYLRQCTQYLLRVRRIMQTMAAEELRTLERMLGDTAFVEACSVGQPLWRETSAHGVYRAVCRIADDLQMGHTAKEFSDILKNVLATYRMVR
ncbi:hypothetical protein CXG81DRAFT_23065 [Caulochytrium protostelioides]|uniref:Uncharacterized protein n=1 Tax=Caulochytrium protostelioides TaxID=1555241 RepID=A0A4V1IVJ6_9FUNG|nr:hypothetical protein CXG81DRAFT_23065 [Caulochytrium protostelioides]|eukprot:RKP04289.1 hypothetical protein CXG81DRAFT_23065 [Caulochytrium protostelioides]